MLRADNRLRQQQQEHEAQSQGSQVEAALKEEDGRILVKHIREMLSRRLDDLVKADPEAFAYVKMLKELGMKIAVGRHAAEKIIARELKEVG